MTNHMPRIKKRQHEDNLQKLSPELDSKRPKASDQNETYDFTKAKSYTDLVLKVDGRCLYVCRSMLMMASPVFQKMFESDFCEIKKDVVELPHKNFDDLHYLLKLLVPGCRREKLTYDVALKVFPLAHEYQMDDITTSCLEVLVKTVEQGQIKLTDIPHWFSFAATYGLTSLEDACTKHVMQMDILEMKQLASISGDITVPWRSFTSLLKTLASLKEKCAQHEEMKDIIQGFFDEHEDHCKTRHISCTTCCRQKCEPVTNWTNSRQTLSPHCWQHIVYSLTQCTKFTDWLVSL